MDTIVNCYDLTCEMRSQIGILQHKHMHKGQVKSFNMIGILALICFGSGFWMKTLWYPAIILAVFFLIYKLWMMYHVSSIKKEFSQNAGFYPVEKVVVECDDKIKITIDESEHTEVYDYSMVCDIKETTNIMVLFLYTRAIAFVKEGAGTEPEELARIKARCAKCKRK